MESNKIIERAVVDAFAEVRKQGRPYRYEDVRETAKRLINADQYLDSVLDEEIERQRSAQV